MLRNRRQPALPHHQQSLMLRRLKAIIVFQSSLQVHRICPLELPPNLFSSMILSYPHTSPTGISYIVETIPFIPGICLIFFQRYRIVFAIPSECHFRFNIPPFLFQNISPISYHIYIFFAIVFSIKILFFKQKMLAFFGQTFFKIILRIF